MKGLIYPYDECYSTAAEWGQYPRYMGKGEVL